MTVTGTPNPEPPRAYPLARSADDTRFTFAVALEVAEVLEKHGYPSAKTNGMDFVALQQALFGFIYSENSARPQEKEAGR